MKILALGDMHIKPKTMLILGKAMECLIQLVETVRPDYVVLLGDQLDGHEQLNLSCLHALTTLVGRLLETTRVLMLVGNHDMLNNQQYCNGEHAFSSMRHMKGLTVVDRPIVANAERANAGEEPALICCPFLPRGRFCEALDGHMPREWEDWRHRTGECMIFAHQEFRNVVMDQVVSTEGDEYDSEWPQVISGHIHECQRLGSNIYYAGTPWPTSFTRNVQDKTVALLTVEGGECATVKIDRVALAGVPRRLLKTVDLAQLEGMRDPVAQDCLLKIVVSGNADELKAARKIVSGRRSSDVSWSDVIVEYRTTHHVKSDQSPSDIDVKSLGLVSLNYTGTTMKRLKKLAEDHRLRDSLLRALEEHSSST